MKRLLLLLLLLSVSYPVYGQISLDQKTSTKTIVRADCEVTISSYAIKSTMCGKDISIYIEDKTYKQYTKQIDDNTFEIGLIFTEAPGTNVFDFKIEGYENFDFYYQSQILDKEGKPVEMKKDILGSYAVYFKDKMKGKAFHIYRPKLIDRDLDESYCDMDYRDGVLEVTCDTEWLKNAVYPVTLDPTLGLITIGSEDDTGNDVGYFIATGGWVMPVNGNAQSISCAVFNAGTGKNIRVAVYRGIGTSSRTLVANSYIEMPITQTTTPTLPAHWTTGNITATLTAGVTYWFCYMVDDNGTKIMQDLGVSGNWKGGTGYTYSAFPQANPNPTSSASYIQSFYLTYIPSGQGGRKIIKQDGTGDYTSLTAWEAGEQGVLISTALAEIQGTWTAADAGVVTVAGWTTFSTAPVMIQAIGDSRATGIWSNTAYRMYRTGGSGAVIDFQVTHFWIDGVQVERTAASDCQGIRADTNAGMEGKVSNCILRNMTKPTNTGNGIYLNSVTSAKFWVWNNIVYSWGTGLGLTFVNNLTTSTVYNNTISSCSATGFSLTTGSSNLSRSNMKNNIAYGNLLDYGPDAMWAGFSIVLDTNTNISKDASSPNTAYRSKTVTFTNNATNYYLLGSGDTVAKDMGMNLSADNYLAFNTGIQSNARPYGSAWDIGADEYYASITPSRKKVIWIK